MTIKSVKITKGKEVTHVNPFLDLEVQGQECILIVPSEVEGEPVLNAYMDDLKSSLATWFGGFTIHKSEGGWMAANGTLIEEPVYHITVSFDIENFEKLQRFYDIAKEVKLDMEQQCIYVRVGDKTYLV